MKLFVDLAKKDWFEIKIINTLGQTIKVLYDGMLSPGFHYFSWNGLDKTGSRISNGIYLAVFRSSGICFYQIKSDEFVQTEKLTLIR
jgi:flagellar hook assembly protein FlgD